MPALEEEVIDWRRLTLEKIDAPRNHMNLAALGAWAASEGMALIANNPLAATDPYGLWKSYPPSPLVKMYWRIEDAATVYAMKFNSPLYRPIGEALRASDSFQDIFNAINQSSWCGDCQGGKYPIRLWQIVYGNLAPAPPPAETKPEHDWAVTVEEPTLPVRDLHRMYAQFSRTYGHVLPAALHKSRRYVNRFIKAVE